MPNTMRAVPFPAATLVRVNFYPMPGVRTIGLVDESGTAFSVMVGDDGAAAHLPLVDTLSPEPLGQVTDWLNKRVAPSDQQAYVSAWKEVGESQLDYLSKIRALDWMIQNAHYEAQDAIAAASKELGVLLQGLAMISAVADHAAAEARAKSPR